RLYGMSSREAIGEQFDLLVAEAPGPASGTSTLGAMPGSGERERWVRRRDGSIVPVLERRSIAHGPVPAAAIEVIEARDASDRATLRRRLAVAFDTAPHG